MNSFQPQPGVLTGAADTQPANAGLRELLAKPIRFTGEERKIILTTCCGGATQAEADELMSIAEARGLSPLRGECYFVKRWDNAKRREVWAVQISIDGIRIKADETGLYDGQDEPEYEYGPDGLLKLARVRVYRKDWQRPVVGVARFDEYVQRTKEGAPTRFWKTMPHNQLAKCAEALAMRKAFPSRFARIYTPEEMAQAENEDAREEPGQRREPAHNSSTGEVYDENETTEQADEYTIRGLEIERATSTAELDEAVRSVTSAGRSGKLHRSRRAKLREMIATKRKALEAVSDGGDAA